MKALTGVVVLGSLLLYPISSIVAQTYEYVTAEGNVEVEVAHNSTEAIATAPDRHSRSGVAAVAESEAAITAPEDSDTEMYAYVLSDGELGLQLAESPMEAIDHAIDIDTHSGVMLVMQ